MRIASPFSRAPWLSVAMPVHAGERWLEHTLSSVAAQDCSGIEFLLFDSSKDDACQRIAERFSDRLNIRYERMTALTSWVAKTNLAVERSTAPSVAMLHQDDLWLPNRSKLVRQAIADFPDATLFLNPSYIVGEEGRRLGTWRCPLPSRRALKSDDVAERLLVQNFVAIPAPVIRKRAWLKAGGMDPTLWYTADWDLYLKLLRCGSTVYHSTPTTAFRVHGGSLTVTGSRNRADFEAQMKIVVERHLDLVSPAKRAQIRRRANTSITVNCELAEGARGNAAAIVKAVVAVLLLGPRQALSYIRHSRVLERTLPRLRARLAGRSRSEHVRRNHPSGLPTEAIVDEPHGMHGF